MRHCCEVIGAKPFEQFVGELSAKFFTLICDNVQGGAKATVPFVEDGIRNCVSFLIWQGHQFNIFCESVSHAQNKLFTTVGSF